MKTLVALGLIVWISSNVAACGTFNIAAPITVPDHGGNGTGTGTGSSTVAVQPVKTVVTINLSWLDPDTGLSWQVIADSVSFAEATCPASWTMVQTTIPSKFADYVLGHGFPAGGTYWTSIQGTEGHIVRTIETDGQNIKDAKDTTLHMLICTEG